MTTDLITLMGGFLAEMGYPLPADGDPAGTSFSQLGLDSLALLEFLMMVDEHTGVEVTTDVVNFDTTLGELAALVSRQSA